MGGKGSGRKSLTGGMVKQSMRVTHAEMALVQALRGGAVLRKILPDLKDIAEDCSQAMEKEFDRVKKRGNIRDIEITAGHVRRAAKLLIAVQSYSEIVAEFEKRLLENEHAKFPTEDDSDM